MKPQQTTEGWLVVWTPALLWLKSMIFPDLAMTDSDLNTTVTVIAGVVAWIASRLSKKVTVKIAEGKATPSE